MDQLIKDATDYAHKLKLLLLSHTHALAQLPGGKAIIHLGTYVIFLTACFLLLKYLLNCWDHYHDN